MMLWSALVLYLVCDFFFLNGPLKKELRTMFPTEQDLINQAVADGICAKVYNAPIYLSQVDRRVHEKLYRTGRSPEKVTDSEFKLLRMAAMDELIDEHILRIKAKVNGEQAPVSEAEIDAEVLQFEKRFTAPEALDKALSIQGIESREELRFRIAARLQQEKYVQLKITPHLTVSDQEAKQWYDDHQDEVTMPERRRVRHIFLATLDHPSEEAKATLTKHLNTLSAGKADFSKLATEVSEDERSKKTGGDLGWMRQDRLPGDFASPVFSISINTPTLIRTKLGWHIVEVLEIKAPKPIPFEQIKKEIVTSITDSRRAAAVKQYRHQLRLLNHKKIQIIPQVINQVVRK